MINPQLLTAENGFEDGVVVEIEWENCSPQIEYYVWGSAMDQPQKEYMISQYGVSVRPLTGTMSIWNHLPDGVEAILRHPGGITFYFDDPGKEDDPRIVYRPFWATRSGE